MAKEFNNGKRTFLKINSEGFLYESSKKPNPDAGFVERKITDSDGNVQRVVYHKLYYSTDDGYLTYLGIKEFEVNGAKLKYLLLNITNDDGDSDVLSIPLYDVRGNLHPYVKVLAQMLPNLDFNRKISITPARSKNDKGYLDKKLFIKYEDTNDNEYVKYAHKYGKNGDIPGFEIKEKAGKKVYDFTDQDNYLYDILIKEINRFKENRGNVKKQTTDSNQPKKEDNTVNIQKGGEESSNSIPKIDPEDAFDVSDNDLPF